MLKLTQTVHAEIKKHGAAAYPYEGCGLLLGYVEDGVNVVTAVQPIQNVWPVEAEKPIRFRIAEDDWRDAEIAAMLNGLDVVGVFHSHPDNPPVASARDPVGRCSMKIPVSTLLRCCPPGPDRR